MSQFNNSIFKIIRFQLCCSLYECESLPAPPRVRRRVKSLRAPGQRRSATRDSADPAVGGGGKNCADMLEDRQVLRDVWDGRVPICFRLADNEVHTVSAPDPFYLLVPRMTYFPLVIDKVRRHFSRSVHPDNLNGDIWLEWEDKPLRWHLPVGLQYDLLNTDAALPWALVVHFTDHPDECPVMKRDALESFFFSSVKEADQLKHKGSVMSSLGKRDHSQLWAGLALDKFDQFWSVNRHLMESEAAEAAFGAVPVRLYRPGAPYLQPPLAPRSGDGQPRTLRHLLAELAPLDAERTRVIVQGIEPPLETPLLWLSQHFSYADNFLHIVVLP